MFYLSNMDGGRSAGRNNLQGIWLYLPDSTRMDGSTS